MDIIRMLTFHITSNRRLGRKSLSILAMVITAIRLEKVVFLKNILREIYYKVQPKALLSIRSINAKCLLVGKSLILSFLLPLIGYVNRKGRYVGSFGKITGLDVLRDLLAKEG